MDYCWSSFDCKTINASLVKNIMASIWRRVNGVKVMHVQVRNPKLFLFQYFYKRNVLKVLDNCPGPLKINRFCVNGWRLKNHPKGLLSEINFWV